MTEEQTEHLEDACVVAVDPCPVCGGPVDEWPSGRTECRRCLVRDL